MSMLVRDPKSVFLFVLWQQFPWLSKVIREDIQQETALFVHEVTAHGCVEEYIYKEGHVKVFTNVTDMSELVKAARLRLRHIAARYAYRRLDQEKEVRAGMDQYEMYEKKMSYAE